MYELNLLHLLSHADTQDWNLSAKVPYCITTNSRIRVRVTRPWTDYELRWLSFNKICQRDLVISENRDSSTLEY